MVVYVLTLSVTTIIHASSYPGIWSTTVYTVPWFVRYQKPAWKIPYPAPTLRRHRSTSSLDSSTTSVTGQDLETGFSNTNTLPLEVPKARQGRRAIDPPFTTRGQTINPHLPRATRYFELSWYAKATNALSLFPHEVVDQNVPIPKPPRLSEWIRADDRNGINVHTVPPMSP